MYLFNFRIKKPIKNNTELIYNKIKPFLINGAIILSSDFTCFSSLLSPSPIKHCSFYYLKNNIPYVIYIYEEGFIEETIHEFLLYQDNIIIFHYYDLDIMSNTMNHIYNYKDSKYGFFGKTDYCYKLLFNIYNDSLENKFKKKSDFISVFKFLNLEFINSNSFFNSMKFIPKCMIMSNKFVLFK